MELILERELDHQKKAVDALISALDGVSMIKPHLSYENPTFDRKELRLIHNLLEVQKGIRTDYRGCRDEGPYLNLDVKMETGTGKTYVYTQTIYEMHKKFGFNKFIIAVPSLPIKAGTAQFISDSYVKHHFSDACGYNCDIELGILESPKKKKKGFLAMPSAVRDFVTGSCQNTNKIYVLLVNMQLLTNGNMLTRSDYDYLVEGFYRPFDALKATKPVVIIDEPHRFSREQKAYKAIVEELCPQMIIRFGATFPEVSVGTGRNKTTFKDFNNLVYELNACDSFNLNLIKGVAKEHFEPLSQKEEKVKLVTVVSKTSATFQFKKRGEDTKTFMLTPGDSLSVIDTAFEGITISAIGKNFIELTNGQTKFQGEEFNTDIYSSSYQEQEVGRGLRLPVDENGNRISNEEFKLNYIVDFTEADFAQRLVDEINGEMPAATVISKEALEKVAKERHMDTNALALELMTKGYINFEREINSEKRESFFADYPEFTSGVGSNKVTDVNKNKKEEIQIRKAVYSELKELWESINQKYYLFFDADLTNEIPQALHDILRKVGIFGNVTLYSHRDEVTTDGNAMMVREDIGVSYSIKRPLAYNDFLKRISQQTSIPIVEIHKAMRELANEKPNGIPADHINEYSATNIVSAFADWRIEKMQTRFKYTRSNQPVTETALTYKDGTPREIIKQGNVGTMFVEGTPSDKYLYNRIAFDSPLEKENIMTDIDEVVVYGKIPKSSIAIPTIVGENYSPDFMYVVKHKDGTKELNIVVETKLVEKKSTLRSTEDAKIKCAEAFFKQLTIDGYTVSFHTQLSNKKVKQIIEDVISN